MVLSTATLDILRERERQTDRERMAQLGGPRVSCQRKKGKEKEKERIREGEIQNGEGSTCNAKICFSF